MAEGPAWSGMREERRSSSEAVAQQDSRSSSEAVAQQQTSRRRCPFCEAPFTDRMTAWMGEGAGCACCGGSIAGHWPIKAPVRDTDELRCEACGKVLYRAP